MNCLAFLKSFKSNKFTLYYFNTIKQDYKNYIIQTSNKNLDIYLLMYKCDMSHIIHKNKKKCILHI